MKNKKQLRLKYPQNWETDLADIKSEYKFDSKNEIFRFSYQYTKSKLWKKKKK